MKRWLITAFEPFDGALSNSSQIALRALKARFAEDPRLEWVEDLPVTFQGAWPSLKTKLESLEKDLKGVLALGQATGRLRLSLEQLAVNRIDTETADNTGLLPALGKIAARGDEALWTRIPWETFKSASPETYSRSYGAGTFVCNALYYELLNWSRDREVLSGFIHIPVLNSQDESRFAKTFKMEDASAIAGLTSIIEWLLRQ